MVNSSSFLATLCFVVAFFGATRHAAAEISCETTGWLTAVLSAPPDRAAQMLRPADVNALRSELGQELSGPQTSRILQPLLQIRRGQTASSGDISRARRIVTNTPCGEAADPVFLTGGQRQAGAVGSEGSQYSSAEQNHPNFARSLLAPLPILIILASILATLYGLGLVAKTRKRRYRHICQIDARMRQDKGTVSAEIRDVAQTGCRLTHDGTLAVGSRVALDVAGLSVPGKISWVNSTNAGLTFDNRLTGDDLQKILERAADERRRRQRLRRMSLYTHEKPQ